LTARPRENAPAPSRAKAVSFEVKPWQEVYLSERLPDLDLQYSPEPLGPGTVDAARHAEIATVFIRSVVSREVVEALPNLKLVATRSTGYDHVDLEACRERGIAVCNVPRYGENTVAEHTFGLILALTRHIHQAYLRTARGDFTIAGLEGVDLKGRTLGVVGVGRIGVHVIRIAKGFQMSVLAYDAQQNPLLSDVLGFEYAPLEEVLGRADIVSLHLPLLPSTHHLMNRERFAMMKRGAYLVNTARGGIVDTDALLWALDEGILAGTGLDVVEGEELVVDEEQLLGQAGVEEKLRMVVRQHVLLRRENVVLTPHMAFFSREAEQRILDTTIENIRGYLAGRQSNDVLGRANLV